MEYSLADRVVLFMQYYKSVLPPNRFTKGWLKVLTSLFFWCLLIECKLKLETVYYRYVFFDSLSTRTSRLLTLFENNSGEGDA
jgi:hypothetical protein